MNVVLVSNILTPYRKIFYDKLYEFFKSNGINFNVVVMADTEPNRKWRYNNYKSNYTKILKFKSITFKGIYIHVNFDIKRTIEELKPDIVIAGSSYLAPTIWRLISLKSKYKYKLYYWNESHLHEKREYNKIIFKIREISRKLILNKFDGFWYAGKYAKELIKKYCEEDKEMIFVPNLIENEKFSKASSFSKEQKKIIREKFNVEENKFLFICPARLSEVKGIDKFIEKYKNCQNRDKATILIAGEGELKDKIERIIKNNNLDIRLLGYKNEDEMIELYAIADCFLLPSLSDPNPLTCIEALWSGLPLLVSNHVGNYPETIIEGINGYVFNYSQENIINIVDRVIDSSNEWINNAKINSLKIAETTYDCDKEVQRIINEMI